MDFWTRLSQAFKAFFNILFPPKPPQIPQPTFDLKILPISLSLHFNNQYNPAQLDGFNIIIKKFEELKLTDTRHLAYMLATTFHETGKTMKPITEYGSDSYLKAKPYWPYIGRGYVQLTWLDNYKKYGIENTPQKALDPDFAAFILIDGMSRGIFTGKSLSDYFNATKSDPVNARRVVNGLDKADVIAEYYNMLQSALVDIKKTT